MRKGKKKWLLIIVVIIAIGIAFGSTNTDKNDSQVTGDTSVTESQTANESSDEDAVEDESADVTEEDEESDEDADEEEPADVTEEDEESDEDAGWSMEQTNAYYAAENYVEFAAFSKQGLIDQLSSEYGDNYPKDVAEFAVGKLEENGEVDWNEEAREAAENYIDAMGFSKQGLIDQLSSEYGDNYPREIAESAVEKLEKDGEVDWYAEAEEAAENYLDTMTFSKQDLIDQLSSEYGDQFTLDQAQKAVEKVYQ